MADATMHPASAAQATANAADPTGPTLDMTYDAPTAYNIAAAYGAATFTPGAPAMTPA